MPDAACCAYNSGRVCFSLDGTKRSVIRSKHANQTQRDTVFWRSCDTGDLRGRGCLFWLLRIVGFSRIARACRCAGAAVRSTGTIGGFKRRPCAPSAPHSTASAGIRRSGSHRGNYARAAVGKRPRANRRTPRQTIDISGRFTCGPAYPL